MEIFRFREDRQHEFVFPFQLMAYSLLLAVGLSLAATITGGAGSWTTAALFLGFMFLPYYFGGVYYYVRFARTYESSILHSFWK